MDVRDAAVTAKSAINKWRSALTSYEQSPNSPAAGGWLETCARSKNDAVRSLRASLSELERIEQEGTTDASDETE
jgi:hypothetical protein